jgi:hypothetical protein
VVDTIVHRLARDIPGKTNGDSRDQKRRPNLPPNSHLRIITDKSGTERNFGGRERARQLRLNRNAGGEACAELECPG